MHHIQEQTVKGTLFDLHLSAPQVYADNEARDRSGHMSHAMVLTKTGKLLDFNSNCSAYRANGHAAFGWVEYRVSGDKGVTFSEARPFPFSVDEFLRDDTPFPSKKPSAAMTTPSLRSCSTIPRKMRFPANPGDVLL